MAPGEPEGPREGEGGADLDRTADGRGDVERDGASEGIGEGLTAAVGAATVRSGVGAAAERLTITAAPYPPAAAAAMKASDKIIVSRARPRRRRGFGVSGTPSSVSTPGDRVRGWKAVGGGAPGAGHAAGGGAAGETGDTGGTGRTGAEVTSGECHRVGGGAGASGPWTLPVGGRGASN